MEVMITASCIGDTILGSFKNAKLKLRQRENAPAKGAFSMCVMGNSGPLPCIFPYSVIPPLPLYRSTQVFGERPDLYPGSKKPTRVAGFLVVETYLTASLRALAARNFGTRIAGTSMASPVRGLRAVRALRILAEKIPRPAIDTSLPSLRVSTIELIRVSTARSASALVTSSDSCTLLMRSALFIEDSELAYVAL